MADSRIERVTVPLYLQNFSIGFDTRPFMAETMAPTFIVPQKGGKFRIFGKNTGVPRQSNRAPGAIPNDVEDRWTSGNFYTEMYALRTKVYDEERAANAALNGLGSVDLDTRATAIVTQALLVAREIRVAALFNNTANYPGSNVLVKAGGSEWNTIVASTPQQVRTDLDTVIRAAMASAQVPRSMISLEIPELVFDESIRFNSYFIGLFAYVTGGVMTTDLLAAALGVKQVILTAAVYNGALSGIESTGADPVTAYTGSSIWGDTVWAGVLNDGTMLQPTFAQSFTFTGETGGQVRQVRRYRHPDEGARADFIETAESRAEVVTYNGGGAIITNTSSSI